MLRLGLKNTRDQVLAKAQTVVRLNKWWDIKPGTVIQAVDVDDKDVKRFTRHRTLAYMRVTNTKPEFLFKIDPDGVAKEGYPDLTPEQYLQLMEVHCDHHRTDTVNRIEFEYLEGRP